MPSSSIQIVLDDEGTDYIPGSNISGNLVFNVLSGIRIKSITLYLVGDCSTTTSRDVGGDIKNCESHVSNPNGLGVDTVKFLRITSRITGETAYSPGEHRIPFSVQVPTKCTNDSSPLRLDWKSTPLPSTVKGFTKYGFICYRLHAVAEQSSLMSNDIRNNLPIYITSAAAWDPNDELFIKRQFSQQGLNVNIYDSPGDSWGQWTKRLVGMLTPVDSFPLHVRMEHFAAGLPAWNEPLNKHVALQVFMPASVNEKKIQFKLHHISAKIKYLVVCAAFGTVDTHTLSVDLFEKKYAGGALLEFTSTHNNQLVCDLTPYLNQNKGQTGSGKDIKDTFVTERVPSLSISASLDVSVGIVPASGDPIRPQYANLSSVVCFYNLPRHKKAHLPNVHPTETPPPYESADEENDIV